MNALEDGQLFAAIAALEASNGECEMIKKSLVHFSTTATSNQSSKAAVEATASKSSVLSSSSSSSSSTVASTKKSERSLTLLSQRLIQLFLVVRSMCLSQQTVVQVLFAKVDEHHLKSWCALLFHLLLQLSFCFVVVPCVERCFDSELTFNAFV